MELKMVGDKILAALLFISLLQASVAAATTEAVASPNDRKTPPVPRSSRLKRHSKALKQHFANFTPEFNWEQQQYLMAHNNLRMKMHIQPLEWDAGLTLYAHSWAMQRQVDCNYRSHSKGKYGESSFWMQYKDFTPNDVVQDWFSEQQLFDHRRNICKCKVEKDDCECGHYLNVISKTTQRMGCSGYVYCRKQQGLVVYCSYDPPGNYKPNNTLNPRKVLAM